MIKYRIIRMLAIFALIPLFIAFIFPFVRHDHDYGFVWHIWIWGIPFYSPAVEIFFFISPFILLSIGMIVEIGYLLKTIFLLRKDNMKIDVVSRDLMKRGKGIIGLEFLWILWLIIFMIFIFPYGKYFIEVSMVLPLISGMMLITARIMFKRTKTIHSQSH